MLSGQIPALLNAPPGLIPPHLPFHHPLEGKALETAPVYPSTHSVTGTSLEWPNQCQEKNKLKKINSQMFMHFTYTVPHGPLLGQQETTSVRFIGFMKCVSGTIVREMLHYNSVASLKPCFQCLSTFNLLSIIKGIVMHNLQSPLPPPSNCLNCLSRNIKLYLLGIHFAKIHIKLLNQFHQGKKKKKKQ